jgi:hypothetical protein
MHSKRPPFFELRLSPDDLRRESEDDYTLFPGQPEPDREWALAVAQRLRLVASRIEERFTDVRGYPDEGAPS